MVFFLNVVNRKLGDCGLTQSLSLLKKVPNCGEDPADDKANAAEEGNFGAFGTIELDKFLRRESHARPKIALILPKIERPEETSYRSEK